MKAPWFLKLDRQSFCVGWRRRSALILDNAGCPSWFIRLRCGRPSRDWGGVVGLAGAEC